MIHRFIVDGGPYVLPILAASILGLALVLERAFFWLRTVSSIDSGLRRRLLDGEVPPPAATVTDPVARVLVDAVKRPDDLGVAVARAEKTVRDARGYLAALRLVAGAAALLGLIGTSAQLREAFRAAKELTGESVGTLVANALHPTILGLIVFFVAYVASGVFDLLSARLARELDDHLDEVARRRTPILPATREALERETAMTSSTSSEAAAPVQAPSSSGTARVGA